MGSKKTKIALFLAVALGGGVGMGVGAAPARADDKPAEGALAASVDGALAALERAVPFGQRFRIAIAPIVGPGEGEGGLGDYVATRATSRLVGRGVEVIDRGYMQALREADHARKGGPTGETIERLAALYLQADAAISGSVLDVGDSFELGLRLADTRAGKVLATASARIEKTGAANALAPTPGAAPALPAELAIERAIIVKRRGPDGGFVAPVAWDGSKLDQGDMIQVRVRPAEACHLCIVAFMSSGKVKVLYPEEGQPGGAGVKVAAAELVKLPPREGDYWYPLIAPEGVETFFIIAEREAVKTPSAEKKTAQIQKLHEETVAAKKQADALADARAKREAARRASDLWDLEKHQVADFMAELDGAAGAFAYDFHVRQAFESLARGDPPPDPVRARDLGAPVAVAGGPVDVTWDGGQLALPTGRVAGSGRVVQSFAIAHK